MDPNAPSPSPAAPPTAAPAAPDGSVEPPDSASAASAGAASTDVAATAQPPVPPTAEVPAAPVAPGDGGRLAASPSAPAADAESPAAESPAAESPAAQAGTAAPASVLRTAGREPRMSRLVRNGALAVLALALLAGTVLLAREVQADRAVERARTEALPAARDAARVLFSYNHTTLDADFARGLAVTTGTFQEEYKRTTTEVVRDVALQYDAVVKAEVSEAGVIRASPDEVLVLVFLNQSTTSTRVEGQKIDQSRVRMRLVERGGDWRVAEVTAL